MNISDETLANLRLELKKLADPKFEISQQKYFKSGNPQYGIPTAHVRKLAKKYYPRTSKTTLHSLCTSLFKSNLSEEATIATQWAATHNDLVSSDFATLQKWVTYLNTWGKVDDFCLQILSHFIVKFPKHKQTVKSWSSSNNLWKRRISAVSFIRSPSWTIHDPYLQDVFDVAETLLDDPEDLVQKGVGWALKIAAETHQKQVFDFVMNHKQIMKRVTLRYAIEKMPSLLRKQAMKK